MWNNKVITPMVNHHFLSPLGLNITIFIIRDSEKLSKLLRETVKILRARNTVHSTEKKSNIPQTDKHHRTSWLKLSPDISQVNFIFRLLYVYMWNRCDFHLRQSDRNAFPHHQKNFSGWESCHWVLQEPEEFHGGCWPELNLIEMFNS